MPNLTYIIVFSWIILVLFAVWRASAKGTTGVVNRILAVWVGLNLSGCVTQVVWVSLPQRTENTIVGSPGMAIADRASGEILNLSGGLGGGLSTSVPVLTPGVGQLPTNTPVYGPAATNTPAPVAAPQVFTFRERSGLRLSDTSLSLYYADGSGESAVYFSAELPNGASACGWLRDPSVWGTEDMLVACGRDPLEVYHAFEVVLPAGFPRPPMACEQ